MLHELAKFNYHTVFTFQVIQCVSCFMLRHLMSSENLKFDYLKKKRALKVK